MCVTGNYYISSVVDDVILTPQDLNINTLFIHQTLIFKWNEKIQDKLYVKRKRLNNPAKLIKNMKRL
jgi:hypothetical protein